MADVIMCGSDMIEPTLVLGYESTRKINNRLHDAVGNPAPGVTFRPASLRRGNMQLLFQTEGDAADAEAILAAADVACVLTSDDRASIEMSFVLEQDGDLTRKLDPQSRRRWVVGFDWREVAP